MSFAAELLEYRWSVTPSCPLYSQKRTKSVIPLCARSESDQVREPVIFIGISGDETPGSVYARDDQSASALPF